MSLNISFFDENGDKILTPKLVENSWTTIRITSYEISDVSPGLYISRSTWGMAVDYPADYPPSTDYEDLTTYGTLSEEGIEASGGLKVKIPFEEGDLETYITRDAGSRYRNKISLGTLSFEESLDIQIKLEPLPIGEARRYFVNINIEA